MSDAKPMPKEAEDELRADAEDKAKFYPGDRRRMTGAELLSVFATIDSERAKVAERFTEAELLQAMEEWGDECRDRAYGRKTAANGVAAILSRIRAARGDK